MKTRCFLLVVMLAICSINTYGQVEKSIRQLEKYMTAKDRNDLNRAMDKLEADVKARMSKGKSTTGPGTPKAPKTPNTPPRPPRDEPGLDDKLIDLNKILEDYQTGTGQAPFFQPSSKNNSQHVVYGAPPSLTVGDDNGSEKDLSKVLGVDVNTSDDDIRAYAGKSGSPVYVDPGAPPSLTVGDDNGSEKDLSKVLGVDVNTSDDDIRAYVGKSGSPIYVDPATMKVNLQPPASLDETPIFSIAEYGKELENKRLKKDLEALRPNGCGTKERPFPDYLFKEVCDNHDINYGIKDKPKPESDDIFLVEMKRVCSLAFGDFGADPNKYKYTQCIIIAHTYYFGVHVGGEKAYNNAQEIARRIAAIQQVQAVNVHVEQRNDNYYIAVERKPID